MNLVKDFSLVIRLREGAPLYIASFACQMVVDPCDTPTEVVGALLTVHALISARLTDNFNLIVQIIMVLLLRGAHSHIHDIS